MATEERVPSAALKERLTSEAHRFAFARAVSLLERLAGGNVRVGYTGPAAEEVVRLRHDPSLSFAPADVRRITSGVDGGPAEVLSTFFGLFGSVSPLPAHMAEDVLAADGSDESALRAFYDILHHRLLSLLFRTTQKHRPASGFGERDHGDFVRRLLCFVGVDPRVGSRPGSGLPALTALGFAPLFAMRPRTESGLRTVLEELFPGVPARVISFVARRVPIGSEQLMSLGVRNTTLGRDTTVGATVEDRAGRFRVVLGPVDRETFDAVSPGGSRFWLLRAVLAEFARGVLEPEVEVVLDAASVPVLRLGDRAASELGRTTRLGGGEPRPIRSRWVVGLGGAAGTSPVLLEGGGD